MTEAPSAEDALAKAASTRCLVYCRVRPSKPSDFAEQGTFPLLSLTEKAVAVKDEKTYVYDGTFGQDCEQEDIFNTVARPCLNHAFGGFRSAIMCYGQTGTGKSFTMCNTKPGEEGIVPRSAQYIFEHIANDASRQYTVQAQFVQIYRDNLGDLMTETGKDRVDIVFDKDRGVTLPGCSMHPLTSPQEFMKLFDDGFSRRVTTATAMNPESSRGHAALVVWISSTPTDELTASATRTGKVTFVDLAGYERFSKTGISNANPIMKDEARTINASLLSLGHVVTTLSNGDKHIPWRNSKLTRLLQDSIGGRSRTTIVLTAGPSSDHLFESTNTLQFGQRAMAVKVSAKVTEVVDYQKLCSRLQRELDARNLELEALKLQFSNGSISDQLKARHIADVAALQEEHERELEKLRLAGVEEQRIENMARQQQVERDNLLQQQAEEIDYAAEKQRETECKVADEQSHEADVALAEFRLSVRSKVEEIIQLCEKQEDPTEKARALLSLVTDPLPADQEDEDKPADAEEQRNDAGHEQQEALKNSFHVDPALSIDDLRTEFESLQRYTAELQVQLTKRGAICEARLKELRSNKDVIASLTAELTRAGLEVPETAQVCASSTDQDVADGALLKSENLLLTADIARAQAQIQSLKERLESAGNPGTQSFAAVADVSNDSMTKVPLPHPGRNRHNSVAVTSAVAAQNQIEALRLQNDGLNSQLDAAVEEKENLQTQLESSTVELERLMRLVEGLKEELSEAQYQNDEDLVQGVMQARREAQAEFERQAADLSEQHEDDIAQLRAALTFQLDEAHEKIEALENQASTAATEERRRLLKSVEDAKAEITALQADKAALQEALEEASIPPPSPQIAKDSAPSAPTDPELDFVPEVIAVNARQVQAEREQMLDLFSSQQRFLRDAKEKGLLEDTPTLDVIVADATSSEARLMNVLRSMRLSQTALEDCLLKQLAAFVHIVSALSASAENPVASVKKVLRHIKRQWERVANKEKSLWAQYLDPSVFDGVDLNTEDGTGWTMETALKGIIQERDAELNARDDELIKLISEKALMAFRSGKAPQLTQNDENDGKDEKDLGAEYMRERCRALERQLRKRTDECNRLRVRHALDFDQLLRFGATPASKAVKDDGKSDIPTIDTAIDTTDLQIILDCKEAELRIVSHRLEQAERRYRRGQPENASDQLESAMMMVKSMRKQNSILHNVIAERSHLLRQYAMLCIKSNVIPQTIDIAAMAGDQCAELRLAFAERDQQIFLNNQALLLRSKEISLLELNISALIDQLQKANIPPVCDRSQLSRLEQTYECILQQVQSRQQARDRIGERQANSLDELREVDTLLMACRQRQEALNEILEREDDSEDAQSDRDRASVHTVSLDKQIIELKTKKEHLASTLSVLDTQAKVHDQEMQLMRHSIASATAQELETSTKLNSSRSPEPKQKEGFFKSLFKR